MVQRLKYRIEKGFSFIITVRIRYAEWMHLSKKRAPLGVEHQTSDSDENPDEQRGEDVLECVRVILSGHEII